MKNKLYKFEINKLARDKMLEIITKQGSEAIYKTLDGYEYIKQLKNKLKEETDEIIEASTQEQIIEEIADLYEAIDAFIEYYLIDKSDIYSVKLNKKRDRGGFSNGLYIQEISVRSSHPKLASFLSNPIKYKRIL
jgi:predicted house-cleaning noncanonical NTP pyrophosphatase (MazG superfamily)